MQTEFYRDDMSNSFTQSMTNLSQRRNSVGPNLDFQPNASLRDIPGSERTHYGQSGGAIDHVLETYRTIKFDRHGIVKRQPRGQSIAELYQNQAATLSKVNRLEKGLASKYVPKISGVTGLKTLGRTEDEEFLEKLKSIKPQLPSPILTGAL